MPITYTDNGGGAANGSDLEFTFTFPVLQTEDVKVALNGVTQATTKYAVDTASNPTKITFNNTSIDSSVQETSGAPKSGVLVRVYRQTTVGKSTGDDDPKAVYAAGSSIRAVDLNSNTEQALYAIHELQNNPVLAEQIDTGAITSDKILDGTIATADIADSAVTAAKLANSTIITTKLATGVVTTDKIAADAVNGTKIADDSINSEHYVDGSIDTAHIGNSQVTTAKIADSNVTTAKLAADAVTGAKIADDQINSEHYVDGSIDTAHIADAQITTAKIVDANVTTAKIAADAVNSTKIADDSIDSEHYVDGSIDTAHIGNNQVTTAKIADANITTAKIASNAVTTDKIADSELSILAGMQSTTASNLASSTALTATTAELNQLDGITLETSVTTNSDTRIPTSKAVNDLVLSVTNALGGFVAIANETSFPTTNPDPSNNAGTVVSISQLSTGLAVNSSGVATISNGAGTGNTVTITGFPSNLQSQTLPASSGLQVQTTSTLHTYTFHKQLASAADIQAISATVNSFSNRYRVSASAPTSSLDGGDLWYDTTNSKLMVYSSQNSAWEESSAIGNFFISTISSSSNTGGGSATANGTAYRFTITNAPTDAQQLLVSVDGVIQKPNAGSSQPSEGFVLVGNDIIFGAPPANGASMFVTVIGSTVGIGTPSDNTVTTAILQNGSVTTAKIVDANVTTAKIADANVTTAKIADNNVTEAKLALNAVTNNRIADGAITNAKIGNNAVATAELADDAVTTAKIADNAVVASSINATSITTAKIADGAVTDVKLAANSVATSKIPNGAVTTAKIADEAVTLAKLEHGTSSNNGKFLRANNGADPTFETVNTDLVSDSSPQLGGDLQSNGNDIDFADNDKAIFGTGGDLELYHSSNGNNYLKADSGELTLYTASNADLYIKTNNEDAIKCDSNAGVELYYNGFSQFSTKTDGVEIKGGDTSSETLLRITGNEGRDAEILMSADDGDDTADHWRLRNNASDNSFDLVSYSGGSYKSVLRGTSNHVLELHYQGYKQAETTNKGIEVKGGDTSNETMLRITGNEGHNAEILMSADEGDDSADHWRLRNHASTNRFDLVSYATGSYVPVFTAQGGSSAFFGVQGAFYIGTNYDSNYTTSTGVRFMSFGGGSTWMTNTFNQSSGGNTPGPYLYNINASHSGTRFYVKVDGGVVNHSGNNSNLCDERMKTNIVDAPSYYDTIKNIGIKKFNYKSEPEGTPLKVGVIAQQVETVAADLVDNEFAVDGNPNEEGTTKMKAVHEEQLFMMSVKALQEAMAKIETLEAKVAALEAA